METWKKFLDQPFLLSDQTVENYAEKYNLPLDVVKPILSDLTEEKKELLKNKTLEEAKEISLDDLIHTTLKEEELAG